jgi:glycosyltransferase involved in cell wall biosynthesis
MRIAWISYMDPFVLSGGGELHNRAIIDAGRRRGHQIRVSAWLRRRPQRLARRLGIHRRLTVDWDADLFVLSDIRNHGPRRDRFPDSVVQRALETGRAVTLSNAWIDACPHDLPCDGDSARCPATCSRQWSNQFYGSAIGSVFVSPLQHRLIQVVLDVPLPDRVIHCRPLVDPSRFRPLGLQRDIDVLYVGHINQAKGYQNLIERFGPDKVTFVGQNSLGVPVDGTHLGVMSQEQLPEIYNRAKIFAHLPEWIEPMGRTVVEAGLCGCELVLNDRVGVTSYPDAEWRDPRELSRSLERFWDDFEAAFAKEAR